MLEAGDVQIGSGRSGLGGNRFSDTGMCPKNLFPKTDLLMHFKLVPSKPVGQAESYCGALGQMFLILRRLSAH